MFIIKLLSPTIFFSLTSFQNIYAQVDASFHYTDFRNKGKQTIFKTFTVGVYTVVFSLLMDKLSLVSEFQERFPILSHLNYLQKLKLAS